MKRLAIRPVEAGDDLVRLTELVHAAYAPHASNALRFWGTHQSVADTATRLASGQGFLALADGEMAGTITVRPPQPDSPVPLFRMADVWSFCQFAVDPRFKGLGVGTALHEWALRHAAAHGAKRMALDTAAPATGLIRMYASWGYAECGSCDWRPHTNYLSTLMVRPVDGLDGPAKTSRRESPVPTEEDVEKSGGAAEPALRELDALLTGQDQYRWDAFYQNRAKPCPFFGPAPDESLAQWLAQGRFRPGRAIDLGCGNGRNAVFLARHGFTVEAVDHSRTALDWAAVRAAEAGAVVSLLQQDVFQLDLAPASYDLVYDSGCFHHIAPHRRRQYVELVVRALKPGGWFGLTCFRPEGGSGYSDDEVYLHRSLGGGLGYSQERLRETWSQGLQVDVLRQMEQGSAERGVFGEPFLWVLLAQKASP